MHFSSKNRQWIGFFQNISLNVHRFTLRTSIRSVSIGLDYIVMTLGVLVGGLTKYLRLISSSLVWIFSIPRHEELEIIIGRIVSIEWSSVEWKIWIHCKKILWQSNDLLCGRLNTRFYLGLMLIALVTLIFHTWQSVDRRSFNANILR